MDETLQEQAPTEATRSAPVVVELQADPTVGYASIQNAVPVVRALRLVNQTSEPLDNLEVVIACNPPFARGTKLRFERLAAGEARVVTPLDLHPDHGYLSDLQEGMTAAVTATVLQGTQELVQQRQYLDVLAYDQWAGTRALPELLAAFCMPNNPAVDLLVGRASKLLRASHPELSMDGYQSKSRDIVWKQVSALYSTLCAENLQYAEPPASFGHDGQKIRTPDRIVETRVATCLDLTMLFASCLEQAGLRPVVLLKHGHAWVGVWLHTASFNQPLTEDAQEVRKRVASGEFLAFETTGVALHHSRRPSLRLAVEQGMDHLQQEADFLYAVDIHLARSVQIKPLPTRTIWATAATTEVSDEAAPIEQTPALPPLDPVYFAPIEITAEDSPEGRLAKWKARLLDLTLRNKLLNFKTTKTTLQLVAPDLGALEDGLAEGAEFRLKPLPALMEGADPRSAQVHALRSGRSPLDDMARDSLPNKELIARVGAETLDDNLLSLLTAARTGLEEGGANTLYLAIGLLKWTEADKAETTHLAPILLVPVTLSRQSVRSGYRLARHDDEAIVNPTLLQLLKSAFELNVAGLDTVHADDRGVDVPRVLQAFRLATRELPKWEVKEEAHLGIFSFTKYLMWKDLQDRTEQLKNNRVVKHLIEHPGEAFARQDDDGGERRPLDERYRPQDVHAPMLTDSSQFEAICAVDSGLDLVLEGPPGTGKSQTITNVIANCVAKGKTVLFVAEKVAALEVVHRRLSDVGLAPFCLELHSSKTKKTDVLAQLGKALEVGGAKTASDWQRDAQRLAALRSELNGVVQALHHTHPNGLDVFSAIGTCIAHAGTPASLMTWTDPHTHGLAELDLLRETTRRIAALGQALGTLVQHPLSLLGHNDWSPTWQDTLERQVADATAALHRLKVQTVPISALLGLPESGRSMAQLQALDRLADVLLAAPRAPAGLARQAHDASVRSRLQVLSQHGRARAAQWAQVGSGWTPQLARLDAAQLLGEWTAATHTWWPRSWWARRSLLARLAPVREDGKAPTAAAVDAALRPLMAVNEEDRFLLGAQAEAEALLEDSYRGAQTDWTVIDVHADWAEAYAEAVTHVAGPETDRTAALHAVLAPLVTEQRALLGTAGATGKQLVEFRDAYRQAQSALQLLAETARPTQSLTGPAHAEGALERVLYVLMQWQQGRRSIQPWTLWRRVRGLALAQGLQGLIESIECGQVALADVPTHFEYSYRSWWLKRTIDHDSVLRAFSSADHERKIREFREADARFQKLTQAYIAATLSGKVPSATAAVVGADSEMGRLKRELQKQRRHLPVRQLVQGLPTLLPRLKPCLLMSPLSVAQYLAAGHSQFDVVVFDEASQIAVWDAVGVIARGKQLVVVGDPKQLPPTNFFGRSADESEGADGQQVEDLESILDECLATGMKRLTLKWHYRSRHESLIAFSNVHYYGSELVTFPSPVTDDVAVRLEQVAGVYDRGGTRTNRAEAEAIVNAIEQHYLQQRSNGLTLGVVTFNQTQQALITTLLEARRRANARLDKLLAQKVSEELFIKNLENVQGDERDIILFSITYGPDAAGKVTMNFGPLNSEGGHRRLNVAISRARHGVVIYSTLKPEQIDLGRVRAPGVRDLKHYLEFARRGPRALLEQALPTGLAPDSPFETAVIGLLRNRGWNVHPQVGCSGYRIDMAVVDPRAPGRYLLGVECDGATYHSAATARDRDRLRQHVLEGLGWRLHRIWSTDWWLDAERELDKLQARLEALLAADDANLADAAGSGPAAPAFETNLEAEPPAAEDSTPTSSLHLYAAVTPDPGSGGTFYDAASNRQIQAQLRAVVEAEGPIVDAVLYRRVARAWGLERTGSRIVERLRALAQAMFITTVDGDKTFYWPAQADPAQWTGFRVAGRADTSKRHIDEVALEELGALMKHILDQTGSTSPQELARTSCRMLGMTRVTAEAEARASLALGLLVRRSELIVEGDQVRPGATASPDSYK